MRLPAPDPDRSRGERGIALVLALLITFILTGLLVAYSLATTTESRISVSTLNATRGFFAAEAGLNLRGAEVRRLFEEWEKPAGASPALPSTGELPCTAATGAGSGDFACTQYELGERVARTYMWENPDNPQAVLIPPGEPYAGLSADEWRYTVSSTAVGPAELPEAILEMRWKVRNVPIFQFFALYDKDLELYPGPEMNVHGPIHSNEDIYFDATDGLNLYDTEISLAGRMYSGRKYTTAKCNGGTVSIDSIESESSPIAPPAGANDNLVAINSCSPGTRNEVTQSALDSAGLGNVAHTLADPVSIPPVEDFDPPSPLGAGTGATAGGLYWEKSDLRVVLVFRDLNGDGDERDVDVDGVSEAAYGVDFNFDGDLADVVDDQREAWLEIRNPDNSLDGVATRRASDPRTCPGMYNSSPDTGWGNRPVGPLGGTRPAALWYTFERTYSDSAWRWQNTSGTEMKHGLMNHREEEWYGSDVWIKMLEVDLGRLFNCLHSAATAGQPILYDGRLLDDDTNGGLVFFFTIDGPDSAAARSDYGVRFRNGAYLGSTTGGAPRPVGLTLVTDHAAYLYGDFNLDPDWIPTALISDTPNVLSNGWSDDDDSEEDDKDLRIASDTTMQVAFLSGTGESGDDDGVENGALNNYPRMLEWWKDRDLNLQTSFVSLFLPRHNESGFSTDHYKPPNRNWDFDQRFRVSAQLPPMTPRFTYSRQEMFSRSFEW